MKKLLMCMCLGVCLFAGDNDLVITQTDIFIAKIVCDDKGGVKEVKVGGYFTCNNGVSGDESMLLEVSNINVIYKYVK